MPLEDGGLGARVKVGQESKHSEGLSVRDSFKRPEKRPWVMRDAKHACSCVEPAKIGPANLPKAGPVFRVSNHYKIFLSRMYHTYKYNCTVICWIWQAVQFFTSSCLI